MARELKFNDVGEDVRLLQRALNEIMQNTIKADGHFGKLTEEALRAYQSAQNLPVNGVYGHREQEQIEPYISGRFLTVENITAGAERSGIPVAMLLAIREVEGRSEGFLADRRPIILFERHKFWQNLANRRGKLFADNISTVHPDICNSQRGGYLGYAREYDRLEKAAGIDKDAAHMSASWGTFQIMGSNHRISGYPKLDDFINAAYNSEIDHLNMVLNFISNQPNMLQAARQFNFHRFAVLYNGPSQQGYDTRLQQAVHKYKSLGFN